VIRFRAAAWILSAAVALPACAEEARSAAVPEAAIVPLEGETRLVVEGIQGDILLVGGARGVLRYSSTTVGRRPAPLPITVSRERGTVRLLRPEGSPALPRRLEIEVPEGVGALVLASESTLSLSEVSGPVEARGSRLAVWGRELAGPIDLLLQGGKVDLADVEGRVDVRGAALEVTAARIGPLSLSLDGGRAAVEEVRGRMDVDVHSVELLLDRVRGPALVLASGGSIVAAGLLGESVLTLRRTPLEIRESAGDVDVTTDADLKFSDQRGPLHVDSYGASVIGMAARNLLEVRCQGATVDIADVAAPVRIQGDGLTVRLKGVVGETLVYVGASDVTIEDVSGALFVESESGKLSVKGLKGPLDIVSRKDDLALEALAGTLQLDADGPEVRVGWASLPSEGESLVRNDGGGAVVTFPAGGGGLVEARASFGSVESEVPGIVVDGTGSEASGAIGVGGRGVFRVIASGDIRLLRAIPKPPPRLVRPRSGSAKPR
jgi:hypothetical protein